MMDTVAIYMRLSNEDANDGESCSIGNQRDLLYAFIRGRREFDGCSILEFCDDGYSGTNFSRPGIQKLLSLAGKTVGCIIVKDFSRFGRNLVEVGDYLDQIFPFLGVRFIAVNEGYDSARGLGSSVSLDVSLKAMVYEMYSRDISEKVSCVKQAKMRKGEYLCGIAFYGYRKSLEGKNKLEVDGPAAEVVRRIFAMASDGMKPVKIAEALNRDGVPSPLMYRRANHTDGMRGWIVAGDTAYWTRESVRGIIQDERYTGCLIGHKRAVVDISTRRTEPVPKEDWIVAEDAQEAIISKEAYSQAQAVLRRVVRDKPNRKPYQKFRGLVKCAYCGRTLGRISSRQAYFACPTRQAVPDGACASIRLEEQALEKKLLEAIKDQAASRMEPEAAETVEDLAGRLQKEIKSCQMEISRHKALQAAAFEDYAEGRTDRGGYLSRKKELARRQEEADSRFQELSCELAMLREQPTRADHGDVEKYAYADALTREMLVEFIKEIRVSGKDDLEIFWSVDQSDT